MDASVARRQGVVGVRSDIAQTSPHMFFVAAVPLTLRMQHSVHSNPFSPQPAEPREEKNAIIVGASVGGLSAALALQRAGFDVQVFEKAKKLRPAGAAFGIFENGRAALSFAYDDVARAFLQFLVEIGSGKVLTGLARRIDRSLEGRAIGTADDVRAFTAG